MCNSLCEPLPESADLSAAMPEPQPALSPSKLALLARQLRPQRDLLLGEPIAIVGMSVRFPGDADSLEAYWKLLAEGRHAISRIPEGRWDAGIFRNVAEASDPAVQWGAFLPGVFDFDADFFRITPREAITMDPQQRLLLEVSWQALENAALAPSDLFGSQTGVFVGISYTDYGRLPGTKPASGEFDTYATTGTVLSVAAGRISYALGLHGPSMAIDTACSSSLTSVHLACQSLRAGECDVALAGGVNVLSPPGMIAFAKLKALAFDGRCKTFDASADGYVRGEGCGMIVLKRLSDALAAGDPIQALIRGSAVNQDGRSAGLTAPNGPAQEAVIRKAISGLCAADIDYIEAHGAGTPLGDPIEIGAIAAVMSGIRGAGRTLAIGSVKTNIGHLESAAGIAGLVKVVLALQNERIPAHLNFKSLNPNIPLDDIPAVIPVESMPWPRRKSSRMAGVSAFGFSGTNAHVVLEEAPAFLEAPPAAERACHLLALSAQTPNALRELVSRYVAHLDSHRGQDPGDLCFTANTGRSHFRCRAAFAAETLSEMRRKLAAFPEMETIAGPEPVASLAARYLKGETIDWTAIDEGYSRRKLNLPTYPFQRKRFNITDGTRSAPSSWFHDLRWIQAPPAITPTALTTCLLLADQSGIAGSLASALERNAVRCIVSSGRRVSYDELCPVDLPAVQTILCFWGLDATLEDQDPTIPDLLTLIQNLAPRQRSGSPRLWIVTRGAQRAGPSSHPVAVAQAPLWGFGRVIASEHSGLWGGLIDLDPESSAQDAEALFEALSIGPRGEEIASRGRNLFLSRIMKSEPDARERRPAAIRTDGAWLITGGLGALGLAMADWLSARGAKHLALLGRHAPSAEQQAVIRRIDQRGTRVCLLQADIADAGEVERSFKILARELPPLCGVIHAAGILDDGFLANQHPDRLRNVIRPKVQGAWNLHSLTLGTRLDWFIMFSSASALLGTPGQAAYAAGNEFLNALAHQRRYLGLSALTVCWGPWGEIGMMVEARKRVAGSALGRAGVSVLPSDLAIDALDSLLASGATSALVMNADWTTVLSQFPPDRSLGRLSELVSQPAVRPVPEPSFDLRKISPNQRLDVLKAHLQTILSRILRVEETSLEGDRNLLDLGVDSLMAMEIVTDLQHNLSLTLYPREFYEHPTLNRLAEYLNSELDRKDGPRPVFAEAASVARRRPRALGSGRNRPIVFLLSSPRAGSTLLRAMLGGHPKLFCPPELHLLAFDGMRDREKQLGPTYLSEGLEHAFVELTGCDTTRSREWMEGLIARDTPVEDVYRILQDLAGDRLIVDKSPSYAGSLETLESAEDIFESPKYIHLVRHPIAVINSFVNLRMDKLLGVRDADPYWVAEQVWTTANRNALTFQARIGPDRWRRVRYEELVRSPEPIMRELCDFLEIPFHSALLNPYEGERMTQALRPKSTPIGDPNFLKHTAIEPGLADAWKTVRLPRDLTVESRDLAQSLGFDLGPPVLRPAGGIRERTLSVRGLDLCLCEWGDESNPLVLCLHGALDHGGAWDSAARHLASLGYHVLAPDQRGHGKSGHAGVESSYHLLDFLGDLDAIASTESKGPMILAGHSMGALIATLYAGARPERVASLILVELVAPESSNRNMAVLSTHLDYLATPLRHPVLPGIPAAAERLRKATPSLTEEQATACARRITEPVPVSRTSRPGALAMGSAAPRPFGSRIRTGDPRRIAMERCFRRCRSACITDTRRIQPVSAAEYRFDRPRGIRHSPRRS